MGFCFCQKLVRPHLARHESGQITIAPHSPQRNCYTMWAHHTPQRIRKQIQASETTNQTYPTTCPLSRAPSAHEFHLRHTAISRRSRPQVPNPSPLQPFSRHLHLLLSASVLRSRRRPLLRHITNQNSSSGRSEETRVTVAHKPSLGMTENAKHACFAANARTWRRETKCSLDKSTARCLSNQEFMHRVALTSRDYNRPPSWLIRQV